jgi:hypothetical protein
MISNHRHTALSGVLAFVFGILITTSGCDAGLEPPEDAGSGTINGTITYIGDWPPSEQLEDLRFIGMRFVPQDTTDFFRLNEMVISERLPDNVEMHTFTMKGVPTGTYFYSGVAQKYASDLLAWRPVGLVESDGGVFTVQRGGNVAIQIMVDFANPPLFPPQ